MGHQSYVDNSKPVITGTALSPIEEDDVEIVEGKLGNPIPLNDDDIFKKDILGDETPGEFYVLVAGRKGKSAQEVAENLSKNHKLRITPFIPGGQAPDPNAPSFELAVNSTLSYHYLDKEVKEKLRFEPNLNHLAAIYGNDADYYMISCHIEAGRDQVFSNESRKVASDPSESVNTRKFDFVQESLDGRTEVLNRGGLMIFDRQDLNGKPDELKAAVISDIHLSSRADEFEKKVAQLKDKKLYIDINNPNANFDAIINWANHQYDLGKLDFIFLLGDNKDADSRTHGKARRLTQSNDYIVAKMLNHLKPATFAVPGNHDFRPEEHPARIKASDFNLSSNEVGNLEGRYEGDLVGLGFFFHDAVNSIMATPDALIGYHYMINPFQNYSLTLGKGDPSNPKSRETRFVFLTTGEDDLAHFRQDDEIYKTLQWWPWQFPLTHLQSVVESVRQATPDAVGLSDASLAWLAGEINIPNSDVHILGHAPLINSKHRVPYDPANPTTPLEKVKNEDLTFGTTAHPDPMLDMIARSPNVLSYTGGHIHIHGNAYVLGSDIKNNLHYYRGALLETLDRLPKGDAKQLRDFWHPHEACRTECTGSVHDLFEEAAPNLHNSKMVWQAGTAGMGRSPNFTVETITPEGFIGPRKTYYVAKKFIGIVNDDHKKQIERFVTQTRFDNDDLLKQWERYRKEKDKEGVALTLSVNEEMSRIRKRLDTTDASFLAHGDANKKLPRYEQSIKHSFISPTKINDHLKLRLHGLGIGDSLSSPFQSPSGLSLEYLFSQDQLGPIARTLFLEGLEAGWMWEGQGNEFYAAARTPAVVDWQISTHVILRGVNFSLGLEAHQGPDGVDFGFQNDMNIAELNLHLSGWEFGLGYDRENIFQGEGRGSWFAVMDRKF